MAGGQLKRFTSIIWTYKGVGVLKDILKVSKLGCKVLTVYAFSTENWIGLQRGGIPHKLI